jgi:hypothetical protein
MRIPFGLFLAVSLLSPAMAQTSLGYLDLGSGVTCCIAIDFSGNTYVAGGPGPAEPTVPGSPAQGIVIAKFDHDLRTVFRFAFGGSGYYAVRAIAVDGQGNIFVAGQTTSPDFPLVHPLTAALTKNGTGFVSKINAAGDQLVFSTLLGGSMTDASTDVSAMATDGNGDIYLTGYTSAADFPITPKAYQRAGPVTTASGTSE